MAQAQCLSAQDSGMKLFLFQELMVLSLLYLNSKVKARETLIGVRNPRKEPQDSKSSQAEEKTYERR